MEKFLTVFTPTYNRAYILPQLYKSLCNQTCKDFTWLIIDDGSSDNTAVLIQRWIQENKIDIIYRYQDNAGKMAAYNCALAITATPLFMCIDSDDYLVEDAVDSVCKISKGVVSDCKLSGIVAYRGKKNGSVLGTEFPENIVRHPLRALYKKGFQGDTTLIYKTQIAKEYPFPILPGEKFISEMFVYNQIDEKYEMQLLRKVLTICTYLDDGYTNNGYSLVKNNPMGWALIYQQKKFLADALVEKLKNEAFSGSYVLMASKEARKNAIEQGLYHITWETWITSPVSAALYLRRKWVHHND